MGRAGELAPLLLPWCRWAAGPFLLTPWPGVPVCKLGTRRRPVPIGAQGRKSGAAIGSGPTGCGGRPAQCCLLWLSLRTAGRPRSGHLWVLGQVGGPSGAGPRGSAGVWEGLAPWFTCLFSAQGPCGPTHTARSWPLRAAGSPRCCPCTHCPRPHASLHPAPCTYPHTVLPAPSAHTSFIPTPSSSLHTPPTLPPSLGRPELPGLREGLGSRPR